MTLQELADAIGQQMGGLQAAVEQLALSDRNLGIRVTAIKKQLDTDFKVITDNQQSIFSLIREQGAAMSAQIDDLLAQVTDAVTAMNAAIPVLTEAAANTVQPAVAQAAADSLKTATAGLTAAAAAHTAPKA